MKVWYNMRIKLSVKFKEKKRGGYTRCMHVKEGIFFSAEKLKKKRERESRKKQFTYLYVALAAVCLVFFVVKSFYFYNLQKFSRISYSNKKPHMLHPSNFKDCRA